MPLLTATGGGWGFPSPFTTTATSTTTGLWSLVQNSSATLSSYTDTLQMLYLNSATQTMYSNNATLQMLNYPVYQAPDLINRPNIISSAAQYRAYQREEIERRQEADRIRAAAKKRARELLLSFLTEEQRSEFEANQYFMIEAASGTKYRITYGRIGNIEVVHEDIIHHRLCVHPANEDIPVEDVMLSQLLHLRTNEAELVQRANVHPR